MFVIFLTEGMDPFYQNITSFPTVFFTLFLALSVLYWLIAVLGFVDLDILDFDLPGADGAVDMDLDIDSNNALTNPDVLAGLMLRFGLHGVPVTVIVSFIALFGWLVSYYVVHFLFGIVPDGVFRYLAGLPVLAGALYLAVMVTSVVIKPIRPLFKKAQQETDKKVLGQTAVVRTSRVDSEFGEAVLEDGGAGLILKVRATDGEAFEKGDRVVLLEHIQDTNTYRVISEREFRGD